MSVCAFPTMGGNPNEISRNVEACYQTVDLIALVLKSNCHGQAHTMRSARRCSVDVHDIGTNVASHLEREGLLCVDAVSFRSSGDVRFNRFRRHVLFYSNILPGGS